MLKMRVADNPACGFAKEFYIYAEKDGKRYFAKPVQIIIEETHAEDHEPIRPTFSIHSDMELNIEQGPPVDKILLDQKQNDKTTHIDNLNDIIFKLIEVKS